MLMEPCFSVTLHDKMVDSNQMLLDLCFSMRPQDDTAWEKGGVNPMLLGLCLCMTPQDARGEWVLKKCCCS